MDRIEEHNIEAEDLEQFVINILKGIKAADVIEARYVLRLDLENVHRIADMYSKCTWIEIY